MTAGNIINFEERRMLKNNDMALLEAENNLLKAILLFITEKDETAGFDIRGIYEIVKDMSLEELDYLLGGTENRYYTKFKSMGSHMQECVFMNLKAKLMLEVTEPNF